MNGLEQVRTAVAKALERAGVAARTAFAPGWAKKYRVPVVAVGLRTGESRGGAIGSYLGQRMDPETLVSREIYGIRLDLTLSLDVYCPATLGASGCDGALETLHQVLMGGLPTGLKPVELKWEEPVWDGDAGMFLRKGSLRCDAFFTASYDGDGAMFTDFILKGVVTK